MKTKQTLAQRLDEIAARHGWRRAVGAEHRFARAYGVTRVYITFSMRGCQDFRITLHNREGWDDDCDPLDAAVLAPGTLYANGKGGAAGLCDPMAGESADLFLERTLAAFDLRKVQAAIVERRLAKVANLEKQIEKDRAVLKRYAKWFGSDKDDEPKTKEA